MEWFAQQHLIIHRNQLLSLHRYTRGSPHAKGAKVGELQTVTSNKPIGESRRMYMGTGAHVHVGQEAGHVFWWEFANRFRLTKSDHTPIWKLYFLTWAIFWKIDSDVWNWFRTVVRNVQYKWKKLVFNVFSSQLFLLSKYALWGLESWWGKYRREVWSERGYFLEPKIHATLECISNK